MTTLSALKDCIAEGAVDEALALWRASGSAGDERLDMARAIVPVLLRSSRAHEAHEVVSAAAAMKPNLPWVVDLQIKTAEALGDDDALLAHLRHAFQLAPELIQAYAAYAAVLVAAGRPGEIDAVRREHEAHVEWSMSRLPQWEDPTVEAAATDAVAARSLYLDLLERTVSNSIYCDPEIRQGEMLPFDAARREVGRDIPTQAHSMIGLKRLHHLRIAVEDVLRQQIPGDLVEAGVWRGGACILMAGVLRAWGDLCRKVVAADSFCGLPPPDPRYPKDSLTAFNFHLREELSVGATEVRSNFGRYGLWGPQVHLLEGLFCDTLPRYPYGPIAILRMDGDLYSSTMDTLAHLYDRVSPGGFVISDDYGVVIDARRAVLDFRLQRGITEPLIKVDGDAVYWRKK